MKRQFLGFVATGLLALSPSVMAAGAISNLPVVGALLSGHAGNSLSGLIALGGVVGAKPGLVKGLIGDVPLIGTALTATGIAELASLPGLSKLKLPLGERYTNSTNYSGLQLVPGGGVVAAILAGLPVTATSATSTLPGSLTKEVRGILSAGKKN